MTDVISESLSNDARRAESDLILSPSSTLCSVSPVIATVENEPSPPRLEISYLDTSPFSDSFHGLIDEELELLNWREDTKAANIQDTSYDIERYTNVNQIVPGWNDEDVDEILFMCPKRPLATIEEEPTKIQPISIADFQALPDHLRSANGSPLFRKHDTGRLYAMKIFSNCSTSQISEMSVLEALMEVKAPFLPRICYSFWNDYTFCMAMEYYSRETLKDIVSYERALNTERALFFACEVVQALTALHATGIIHRDLRPEHVLVDDAGHIVVEGFESSEIVAFTSKDRDRHPVLCSALVGNISVFSAPELLLGWSHDYLVDTWAFGALLLFMLSGKDILRDRDTSVVDWKEMIVNRPIILPLFLESAAHDLISECLERNPMARPSLVQIKKHIYFCTVDWKKVAAKRIRVPSGLYTTAVRGRKHFRARLEKVVSAKNRARGLHHTQAIKPLRSSETISTVTGECSNSPDAPQTPLIPQKLIRMQGEEPKELDQVAPLPDSPVDCASALDDLSSNAFNLKLKLDSQNRMASFWDSLDAEEALESTVPSRNVATLRPRKLRKARSEIYSSSRGSTFGTRSLQNLTKLGKFGRSTYVLPHEKLQLPEGIKQIGGGIGFQYKVPAAARSKASIGTSPPQTCRGFFQGRLQGLGIEILRSPAIAKEKAKRSLKNLLLPVKSDVQCLPPEWKGSSWSLLMPASPESDSDLESSALATVGSSPTTEDRASTPNSAIHDAVGLMETQDFDFEEGVMLTGGHMTLRLVVPAEAKEDIEYARM